MSQESGKRSLSSEWEEPTLTQRNPKRARLGDPKCQTCVNNFSDRTCENPDCGALQCHQCFDPDKYKCFACNLELCSVCAHDMGEAVGCARHKDATDSLSISLTNDSHSTYVNQENKADLAKTIYDAVVRSSKRTIFQAFAYYMRHATHSDYCSPEQITEYTRFIHNHKDLPVYIEVLQAPLATVDAAIHFARRLRKKCQIVFAHPQNVVCHANASGIPDLSVLYCVYDIDVAESTCRERIDAIVPDALPENIKKRLVDRLVQTELQYFSANRVCINLFRTPENPDDDWLSANLRNAFHEDGAGMHSFKIVAVAFTRSRTSPTLRSTLPLWKLEWRIDEDTLFGLTDVETEQTPSEAVSQSSASSTK